MSKTLLMTLNPKYEEAQNEEMMCLQAIYRDDFEMLPPDGVCQRFKIAVIPHPTNQYQNYCSVKLCVTYTPNYPDTLPNIELEKVRGLSDDQIEELYILLEKKMIIGEIVVFELCQAIQEFLLQYNKETVSLHEEMIQRLKEHKLNSSSNELRKESNDDDNDSVDYEDDYNSGNESNDNEEYDNNNDLANSLTSSGMKSSGSSYHLTSSDSFGVPTYLRNSDHHHQYDNKLTFSYGFDIGRSLENSMSIFEENTSHHLVSRHQMDEQQQQSNPEFQATKIRWKLGSCLGRSDVDATYECTNLDTNAKMVCRQIPLDDDNNTNNSGSNNNSNNNTLKRAYAIQKEVECMMHLSNPQLVRYMGAAIENNTLYIFQEHVGTDTLKLMIEKVGRIEESRVRKYTYQLLLSLLYLHSQHIPHRDVQAKNIFIDDSTGHVLFTNYGGNSTKIFDHVDRSNKNINFWNMQKASVNNSSKYLLRREDFLNLGIVVLEMLTGQIIPRTSLHSSSGGSNGGTSGSIGSGYYQRSSSFSLNASSGSTGSQNDYLRLYEGIALPENISPLAKEFLDIIFNSDANDKVKLEAGLLLKHPFISSHHSLSSSTPTTKTKENSSNNLNQHQNQQQHNQQQQNQQTLRNTTASITTTIINPLNLTTIPSASTTSSSTNKSNSNILMNSTSSSTSFATNPLTVSSSTESTVDLNSSINYSDTTPPSSPSLMSSQSHTPPNISNNNNAVGSPTNLNTPQKSIQKPLSPNPYNEYRYSRYRMDFEEIEMIGKGGFGIVVKSKNKLDGRYYAVKKIKTEGVSSPDSQQQEPLTNKLLREVTTLSRLHHQYVVRYYQAWIEKSDSQTYDQDEMEDLSGDLETDASEDWLTQSINSRSLLSTTFTDDIGLSYAATDDESFSTNNIHLDDDDDEDISTNFNFNPRSRVLSRTNLHPKAPPQPKKDTHTLYIQMEYCSKKTLRTLIDSIGGLSEEEIWRLFRQMVEGLNHIHSQGIIHRDLKPANIFIDDEDNVKIGDFGLATSGSQKVSLLQAVQQPPLPPSNNHTNIIFNNNSIDEDNEQSMTGGVGTPFYCCPEILQKNIKHYGVKVDIYSLGIMLFEMCHPFQTQMERSNILRDLRNDIKFPPGFEALKPDHAQLIRSLIAKDPNDRPTTKELLESDLIPSRIEDDILKEAIKTIANPTLSLFNYLMEKLFGMSSDEHILNRYLYTSNVTLSNAHLLAREKTITRLSNIFKNHGAIQIDTPILFPIDSFLPNKDVVAKFLDEGGTVVYMPFDLTVPWARHVALHGLTHIKRYSIAKVFRQSSAGYSPKELYECDFDIVGPPKTSSVCDAELLRTTVDIMEEFSKELGSNYIIKINHYSILDGVLEVCGVEKKDHGKVYMAIATLHWKNTWPQVVTSLKEIGLTSQCINSLSVYLKQKGELMTCISQLEKLLSKRKESMAGLSDLKMLARNLQAINIIPKFYMDLSLVHNYHYYNGIVFQVVNERSNFGDGNAAYTTKTEIIMAGGRYDRLINSFLPQATHQQTCGVGVTIAIEKMVTSLLQYDQRQIKTKGVRSNSDLEVLVCSLGVSMLTEKLQVATQLWAINIKADYSPLEYSNVEDIFSYCKENRVTWVIILKERSYINGMIKIRHIESRTESIIPRKDLVDFILKAKKYRLMDPPSSSSSSSSASVETQMIAMDSSSDLLNIQVTIQGGDDIKGKLKKIEGTVKDSISKMFKGFYHSKGSSIKVVAVDLPITLVKEFIETDSVSKFARVHKDKLIQLKNQVSKWKMIPFYVIYSYKEDKPFLVTNNSN